MSIFHAFLTFSGINNRLRVKIIGRLIDNDNNPEYQPWLSYVHVYEVSQYLHEVVCFVVHAARMTSLQLSTKEEMMERFLDAAARGDLAQVSTLLSNMPSLINQRGYNDWTALMLAARNGHCHVVEALLSHGYRELICRQLKRERNEAILRGAILNF